MGINDKLGVSTMCFDKKMSKWKEQEKILRNSKLGDPKGRLLVILILYLVERNVIQ